MNKTQLTLVGTFLALVLFFAINIAANATLRSVRADLTEDELFTLDEGSKEIARGIDEPIQLYFYFSRKAASALPQLGEYADRILGILREYERASGGNIQLAVIDPEPFSEEEDQAVEQGVQGVQAEPGGDLLYFGLVGTSVLDAREVIPFFSQQKEDTLEYDISKLIWTLAHPDKTKLGILSTLPLQGSGGMEMMGQQGQPPWKILEQFEDFFEVDVLPSTSEELSEDLDVLMVVHPRGFSESLLYLIDQWALAGRPLIVFVDPQCDQDPGDGNPNDMMSRFTAARDSNLEPLFKAWGFELVKAKVACDRVNGLRLPVPERGSNRQVEIPVVFLLGLDAKAVNTEDPVTRLLGNLILSTPGSLRRLSDATTTFTPLLQTSEEAQEVDTARFQFQADPHELLASFVPSYEKLTLAARVTGEVKSAFPGGKPGEPTNGDSHEGGEDGEGGEEDEAEEGSTPGLQASTKPLNLIVFSDADLLHDRLWMRELGRLGSQSIVAMTSENVDLVKNSVESLAGGKELMSIRTRGNVSRPFERVQAMQRDAEQRYLAEQQDLERKLQDTERRLRELETAREGDSQELVTAEQRKERERIREEFVQTRKDLREVQHKLRKDIERLGTSLKWLNIVLMPVLVIGVAVLLGVWSIKQRGKS